MQSNTRSAWLAGGGLVSLLVGLAFLLNAYDVQGETGLDDVIGATLEGLGLRGSGGVNGYVVVGLVLIIGGFIAVFTGLNSASDDDAPKPGA